MQCCIWGFVENTRNMISVDIKGYVFCVEVSKAVMSKNNLIEKAQS